MAREFGKVCQHGQLARSCNICELEQELREAREQAKTAFAQGEQHGLGLATTAATKQLEEEVERLRKALDDIERNYDHEHRSKGSVRIGQCDGLPTCRCCIAAAALFPEKEPGR